MFSIVSDSVLKLSVADVLLQRRLQSVPHTMVRRRWNLCVSLNMLWCGVTETWLLLSTVDRVFKQTDSTMWWVLWATLGTESLVHGLPGQQFWARLRWVKDQCIKPIVWPGYFGFSVHICQVFFALNCRFTAAAYNLIFIFVSSL